MNGRRWIRRLGAVQANEMGNGKILVSNINIIHEHIIHVPNEGQREEIYWLLLGSVKKKPIKKLVLSKRPFELRNFSKVISSGNK